MVPAVAAWLFIADNMEVPKLWVKVNPLHTKFKSNCESYRLKVKGNIHTEEKRTCTRERSERSNKRPTKNVCS